LLAALFLTGLAPAAPIDGDAGSKGFKFLQVMPDAQAAATARASVASGGRQMALIANPAGLATLSSVQIAAAHTEWLASVRHEYLGLAWPQFRGTLAVAVRTQSSGDIPLRTVDSGASLVGVPAPEPSGTYGVHDAAFSVAYARRVGSLDWGAGVSYVYEKIFFSSVSAVALDLGARWRHERWSVGATLRNVGVSGTLRDEKVPLPWDAQAGVTYELPVVGVHLCAMADVRYAPDYFETLHLGTEVRVINSLALRVGYHTGLLTRTGDSGLTAGMGLRYGPLRLDYAYIPERDGLGSTHIVSLALGG